MKRPVVGGEYKYRDHLIRVELMQPDYLLYVDGMQVGQFWLTPFDADAEAHRYIDFIETEKASKNGH
jgi:hypothetical protein